LPSPDALERRDGALLRVLHRRAAPVEQGQLDVLHRRRARQEVEPLEDEAELRVAQVGELRLAHRLDGDAVEHVVSARRLVEAAEDVQHRRLAGARRAHDRHQLTGVHREVHAAERVHRTVAFAVDASDVVERDDGMHGVRES
jgi:hypothetical protein